MKIFFISILSAVAANPPTPPPEPKVIWTAECELKSKKIQIEAKSLLGEKDSPDMKINVVADSTSVEVPLGEAALTSVVPTNKKFGICSSTAGVIIDKTKLLLLIGKSGKPNLDHLTAVLIDTETLKVLDTREDLGDYVDSGRNKIFLKKVSGGVSALIAQGWKRYAKAQTPDNLFMGWLNITVAEDKISSKWEMDLPNSHTPYAIKQE